jgi:hypothetical protein
VFSQPQIKDLLDQYVIVKLYTDRLPPTVPQPATSAADNLQLLETRFGSRQLPLYVIMAPDGDDGREVARYAEGKINSVEGFADFLRQPLTATAQRAQAGGE